jgi:hypothetical protein
MSVQSEVADMYELMLWKGASKDTARAVATALYRELVPDGGSSEDEVVSRAIATVRVGVPDEAHSRMADAEDEPKRSR